MMAGRNENIQGISVVIPTYNRAYCIMNAVRSAIEQNPPPLEVIVIDDGSSDNTFDILKEFGHPLVHCHRQSNRGLSEARNAGIRMARADLVAFIDSDDIWLPGKLAAQEQIMRQDETCALVFTDMRETHQGRVTFESVLHGRGYTHLSEGYLYEALLHESFIIPSTVMIRMNALMECGLFDPLLRSSEDRDLWLRLSETRPFRYVDQPLCIRNRGEDGLTEDTVKWMGNQLAMFKKHLDRRRNHPLGREYEGRHEAMVGRLEANIRRTRSILARLCLGNNDLKRARTLYRQSLRDDFNVSSLALFLAAHLPASLLMAAKRQKSRFSRSVSVEAVENTKGP